MPAANLIPRQTSRATRFPLETVAMRRELTCAECQAQRNLLLPNSSACEQQIGNICAGDEKHKSDCAEQNKERRLNIANNLFVERNHDRAYSRIVIRILLLKARSDRFHLCLRLLQSDAGFHSRDHFEEMITTLRRFLRRERDRHPELIIHVFVARQLHRAAALHPRPCSSRR